MPLQNRVTPFGDIVARPARGTMMGNRGGRFHGADKSLHARRWASRQWICCLLAFKRRRREVMAPGRYTELFFLDEATALAAGHRPCFECRRSDAVQFAAAWAASHACEVSPRAAEIDRALHAERVASDGSKRLHPFTIEDLPDGSMIVLPDLDGAHLVLGPWLLRWSIEGYGAALTRPTGTQALALTPPGIIGALRAGYRPLIHATAAVPDGSAIAP